MIRGVLFDLDGTLADTEPIQWRSYRQVLEPFGVDIGMEEYRIRWIAADGGAEYACERYRLPIDVAELRRRKTVAYRALIAEGVAPCPAYSLPDTPEKLRIINICSGNTFKFCH